MRGLRTGGLKMSNYVLTYLDELAKKGQERRRLTEQLQDLLSSAARQIAASVPLGMEVKVTGLRYRTVRYRSNLGNWDSLAVVGQEGFEERRVIDNGACPGGSFFLHGDFDCRIYIATREEFLHFANHLPEITCAYGVEETAVIAKLRTAFDRLREMAESGIRK